VVNLNPPVIVAALAGRIDKCTPAAVAKADLMAYHGGEPYAAGFSISLWYFNSVWSEFLEAAPGWNGFKQAVEKWLSGPIAILDLRGNGGGSDQVGGWLATRVKGQAILSPYEYRLTSRTAETWAISANGSKLHILINQRRNQPVPDYLKIQLAEQMKGYREALAASAEEFEKETFGDLTEAGNFKPYKGKVYLLIDAECASSCEGTVKFFENVPNATTVGENTGGFFQFGNVGILVLPNSRLTIQMPTAYFRLRDGSTVEKVGVSPKFRPKAGQDALQYVIQNLVP
jgi:hypothetical protein